VSKGGFRTKKQAHEHLTGVMHALQTNSYVQPARQTLAEYFDQWHAAAASRLRPKTLDSYRQVFNRYLRATLGDIRLQSLTALHLDGLYGDLLRAGGRDGNPLSPTTVIHVHAVISKLLSDALRKGVVVRNVAQAASPPRQLRPAERHLSIWSGDQLKAFLASVENERLYALWRLYAVSGCRRGEALAVTWDDIDLERGSRSIRPRWRPFARTAPARTRNGSLGDRRTRTGTSSSAARTGRSFTRTRSRTCSPARRPGGPPEDQAP
jgi:integrase